MTLSRAVIEQRARGEIEEDPQRALWRKLEFFPTPPWAARATAHMLKNFDPYARFIAEPACGQGHFAEPLKEFFSGVLASDVHDYGYGVVNDFLVTPDVGNADWVVTNPPFPEAQNFAEIGLRLAKRGVALLVRLSFLETIGRYDILFGWPASLVVVFSERVPMILGEWDPEADTLTSYCVVVWEREPRVRRPELDAFPPGTERKFTRPDDVKRFAKAKPLAPAPLFETIVPRGET